MFARELPCVCPYVCIRCYFEEQKKKQLVEVTKPFELGQIVRVKLNGQLVTVQFIDDGNKRIDVLYPSGAVLTYDFHEIEKQ